ncbi:arf-GAP with GTPase, ANK repeat and PH domain-containing protein 3 isoform X1, partial [Tachysurus ichikawai]
SRKASEQAKSAECKTDSIGSGRAIPIKQCKIIRSQEVLGGHWMVVQCQIQKSGVPESAAQLFQDER